MTFKANLIERALPKEDFIEKIDKLINPKGACRFWVDYKSFSGIMSRPVIVMSYRSHPDGKDEHIPDMFSAFSDMINEYPDKKWSEREKIQIFHGYTNMNIEMPSISVFADVSPTIEASENYRREFYEQLNEIYGKYAYEIEEIPN